MEIIKYLKKHSYLPKEGIERFAELYKKQISISEIRLRMKLNGWEWKMEIEKSFRENEDRQMSIDFID